MKSHKIKTVQDIFNCTNAENIDDFLKDLKGVLLSGFLVRDLTSETEIFTEPFEWTDDKQNKIETIIKPI